MKRPSDKWLISPLTGERIPSDKLEEHVRWVVGMNGRALLKGISRHIPTPVSAVTEEEIDSKSYVLLDF